MVGRSVFAWKTGRRSKPKMADKLDGFRRRMNWFVENRKGSNVTSRHAHPAKEKGG